MNKQFYIFTALFLSFFIIKNSTKACSLDYISDGATTITTSAGYYTVGTASFLQLPSSLGTLSTLTLNAASAKTFQNLACNTNCSYRNVIGGSLFYRVFKTSEGASGSFNEVTLNSLAISSSGNDCNTSYLNKTYSMGSVVNLYNNLVQNTNYTLQLYYVANVDLTNDNVENLSTTLVRDNGGNYYSTTFTTATTLNFKSEPTPQSIEEASKDVVLFPNPAKEKAFLTLPNFDNVKVNVLIINSVGTIVRQKISIVEKDVPLEVDLDALQSGFYFVRLIADDRRERVKRLIVK